MGRRLKPAERYIRDVLRGKIRVGRWVRKAVERHVRDLERVGDPDFPFYFDPESALAVEEFFAFFVHSKGEWAGEPFVLDLWESFVVWVVFGWRRIEDDSRRFRTVYISVARKNGKSTFIAGLGNYLFVGDDEPGAEIYTAATKLKQAKIIHEEAKRMIERSDELSPIVTVLRDNLSIGGTASKYEPLGKDSKTEDGLNVHAGLIDEYHAHPDKGMFDVIRTATGARRQPIIIVITTAGSNRQSACFEMDEYCRRVLDGVFVDETRFAFIARLDTTAEGAEKDDDHEDPRNWIKANPSLGVTVKPSSIREELDEALQNPAALNTFLRLRMNVWTQSDVRWIPREKWDACGGSIDVGDLEGRECYAGLDLSSTTDLSALVLLFPPVSEDDPFWYVVPFFWIPEENVADRVKRDGVPYDLWIEQGFIFATEGDVIDYDSIRAHANDLIEIFNIHEVAFDRWNATQLTTQLDDDGLTVVPFGQGFASMSAPAKKLFELIKSGRLRHGGNPVLRWMADVVVVETDAAENIKPSKSKSKERIDGIVALTMAVGRASVAESDGSVYDERGIRTL